TSTDATIEERIGRGSYLVNSLGKCNSCHTNPARTAASPADSPINTAAYLAGGRVFAFGGAAETSLGVVRSMTKNLVGATNGFFTEPTADFVTFAGIIQTGLHIDDPDPKPLAAPMPWQFFRNLTADDFVSMYTYLSHVQQGQPTPLTADKPTQDASYY